MKHSLLLVILFISLSCYSTTLKEMYDSAPANGFYDKEIVLNSGEVYTGSLLIGGLFSRTTATFTDTIGANVKIIGNGAILDLEGGYISIQYTNKQLDISDCVIINGGIKFLGTTMGTNLQPSGSISFVTFYNSEDYGVRIHSAGRDITIENNIFVDAYSTGDDFVSFTSETLEWLPTGFSIVFSLFSEVYGSPQISNNWSYFSDWRLNDDPLRHYACF